MGGNQMIETKAVELPGGRAQISGHADDEYFQNVEQFAPDMFRLAALARHHGGADLILDVGGNIGLSCISIARMRPDNKVMVFEPSPRSAQMLRRNIADNAVANVEVVQAAVSDVPGLLQLNDGTTSGASFIWTEANLDEPEVTLTEVPAIVLDNVITEKVSFVKIDVEGHEPNVIAGMRRIIQRDSPLIYTEFNPWCLSGFGGYNIAELARHIFDVFDVFLVDADGGLIPMERNAKGFIYGALVENEFEDIVLKLREGKVVPTLEGLTLPPAVYAELSELRARLLNVGNGGAGLSFASR